MISSDIREELFGKMVVCHQFRESCYISTAFRYHDGIMYLTCFHDHPEDKRDNRPKHLRFTKLWLVLFVTLKRMCI